MQVPTRIDFSFVIDFYRETVAEKYTPAQKNAVRYAHLTCVLLCPSVMPPSLLHTGRLPLLCGPNFPTMKTRSSPHVHSVTASVQVLRHFLELFVAPGVPQEQLTAAIKYIIIPIIQVTIKFDRISHMHDTRAVMHGIPLHPPPCTCCRLFKDGMVTTVLHTYLLSLVAACSREEGGGGGDRC